MKRASCILAAAVLLVSIASIAYSQGDPVACKVASYQPEVMSFHGDSATVLNRLEELKTGLPISKLRVYMFLLETADSAEITLFERVDGEKVSVSKWQGKTVGDLREQVTSRMLGNRGVLCIGEQSKALLNERISPTKAGVVLAPVSARAAFGHTIQKYGDQYMRVTVFLFCSLRIQSSWPIDKEIARSAKAEAEPDSTSAFVVVKRVYVHLAAYHTLLKRLWYCDITHPWMK